MDPSRRSYDFKGPEKTPMSAQCQSILGAGNTMTYAYSGKTGLATWTLQVDSTITGMPINGWAFEAQATTTETAPPAAPTTPTSSSSPADSSSSSPNLGHIIGGVVAAIIVLVIIVTAWWWKRRRENLARLKRRANGEGERPGRKPGWSEQVPLVPADARGRP